MTTVRRSVRPSMAWTRALSHKAAGSTTVVFTVSALSGFAMSGRRDVAPRGRRLGLVLLRRREFAEPVRKFALVDDAVAVEDGASLPAAQRHGGDRRPQQQQHAGAGPDRRAAAADLPHQPRRPDPGPARPSATGRSGRTRRRPSGGGSPRGRWRSASPPAPRPRTTSWARLSSGSWSCGDARRTNSTPSETGAASSREPGAHRRDRDPKQRAGGAACGARPEFNRSEPGASAPQTSLERR